MPKDDTTDWTFDAFGRKASEVRADGSDTTWSFSTSGSGIFSALSGVQYGYYVTETADGAPVKQAYFDNLNRQVGVKTQSFASSTTWISSGATQYDASGRAEKVYQPYQEGGTVGAYTQTAYDDLNRPTSVTSPLGAVTSTTYDALVVTVSVDPDGSGSRAAQTKKTVRNSQGQVTWVRTNESSSDGTVDTVMGYFHDPFGNLVSTTDPYGNVTSVTFDLRGRKTGMQDPDMGRWSYRYNALGELKWQCDPESRRVANDAGSPAECTSGSATQMTYDLLGRLTQRVERDLTSNWVWDTATKGVGKLTSASSDNNYTREHTYDSYGRPSTTTVTIGSESFASTVSYDAAGRIDQITYPTNSVSSGFAVSHTYNGTGYLWKVHKVSGSVLLWQADTVSPAGKVLSETLGNSLSVARTYNAVDQLLTAVTSGVQNDTFTYDLVGNLTQRADSVNSVTENFTYDQLNRLLTTSGSGLTTREMQYNRIGNIVYKSDIGTYYHAASGAGAVRPHAVAAVASGSGNNGVTAWYGYDDNGNLKQVTSGTIWSPDGSSSAGFSRFLTYTGFNAPSVITQTQGSSSYTYTYTYGPDHERVKLISQRPDDTITSLYVHPNNAGGLRYERDTKTSSGEVEHKYYVSGGAGLVGVYVVKSTGSQEMRYYHKDHLDSIVAITNPSQAVIQALAYEAFGERRNADGSRQNRISPLVGIPTDRGFTTHEHLDELNLVHMNGRIYDPALGRFMTADPYIASGSDLQSYNRYSYVNNNSLAYTDPSGYFKLKSLFKAAAVVAIAIYAPQFIESAFISSATSGFIAGTGGLSTAFVTLGGEAATLTGLGSFAAGAAGGFGAAFIASNGNLDASLRAGLTGGLGGLLAGYYGAGYSLERVGAESLLSGVNARLQGRPFAEGFRRGLAFSGLTYGNYLMREEMIANSRINPDNINGASDGFFGDGLKLAGGRQTVYPGTDDLLPCLSVAGGCQGAPNLANGDDPARLGFIRYNPGSIWDRMGEAFAGPHDWMRNLTGSYNEFGNSFYFQGSRATLDSIMNYALLVPAAPFAGAALLSWPRSAFSSLTVRKR